MIHELDPVTRRTWLRFFGTLSLILIPLAPAIAYLYIVLRDFFWGILSRYWSMVDGLVLLSALRRSYATNIDHYAFYYRYEVDGIEYLSSRKKIGGGEPDEKLFDRLRKYDDGDTIPVFYSKRNPRRSTLTTGVQWDNLLQLVLIPLITFFQLILFWIIHIAVFDLTWLLELVGL